MTMLARALALARQGFQVFPIAAGAKSPPLVRNWQRVATSEETQVENWWTQWPEANIGVHCVGLAVIDVDPEKGGYESLDALHAAIEAEDGCGLTATLEVETPSRGRHLYYRASEDVRNGVDVLGPGLDIRSTNGYVVGAGSQTPVGEYRVVVQEAIADVPPGLYPRLRQRPKNPLPNGERPAGVDTDADIAIGRAVDFLRTHPVAVEGQGGDEHTYVTICRIRDFGVPRESAFRALAEWNKRCEPPWDAEALEVKIRNAYQYARYQAGNRSPEALGFEVIAGSTPQTAHRGLMHPADVVLDDVLKPEYLIKGVLERQSNAVLFGQWNVGKTFVVLDMAACIATGVRWCDRRVRQGKVLYLGYEGLRAMKKRLKALRDKYPALADRSVPFRYEGLVRPLTQAEGHREVGAILESFEALHGGPPDLVIIDPLANALGGDDSDAQLMGALNQFVASLMKRQHCTVLRVHHSGHGNQDRARGHSSLPAGVDTEIRVTENEIATTKQRDDIRGRMGFTLERVTLGLDVDGDKVTTCVMRYVPDNELDPGLTNTQREVLDAILRKKNDGDFVSKTEVADCMPEGLPAQKRREIVAVLEKKMYLRSEGKGFVVSERGPMAIFD